MKIEFKSPPTDIEVYHAYTILRRVYGDKVMVKFSKRVKLKLRRNSVKIRDEFKLSFGYSAKTKKKKSILLYLPIKRGWEFTLSAKVVSLSTINDENKRVKMINNILKNKHKNVWNELNVENFKYYKVNDLNAIYIKKLLGYGVFEELTEALDNNKSYYWQGYSDDGRNSYQLKVIKSEGYLKVSFCSNRHEYYNRGGNNTFDYILISPNKAIKNILTHH